MRRRQCGEATTTVGAVARRQKYHNHAPLCRIVRKQDIDTDSARRQTPTENRGLYPCDIWQGKKIPFVKKIC